VHGGASGVSGNSKAQWQYREMASWRQWRHEKWRISYGSGGGQLAAKSGGG